MDPTDNKKDFYTIPDVPVDPSANRVSPNQVATGVTRGVQYLGSEKVYSDGGNQQIIVKDTVPQVLMGNQPTFGKGFFVSKAGIDATTNTDATQWIFNSNQNVLKVVAAIPLTVAALTMGANSSGSSSTSIDLSAYSATSIILPVALVTGQPSFIWQGMHGLLSTVVTGTAGWQVVADYSTTFTGGGTMQLSRTLINASASPYSDTAYTIKVYVLQETVS